MNDALHIERKTSRRKHVNTNRQTNRFSFFSIRLKMLLFTTVYRTFERIERTHNKNSKKKKNENPKRVGNQCLDLIVMCVMYWWPQQSGLGLFNFFFI